MAVARLSPFPPAPAGGQKFRWKTPANAGPVTDMANKPIQTNLVADDIVVPGIRIIDGETFRTQAANRLAIICSQRPGCAVFGE